MYGVALPHCDGRAGMAALRTCGALDLAAFYRHLERLPAFARPVLLRLLPADQGSSAAMSSHVAMEVTATFKLRKVDLVREGWEAPDVLLRADDSRTFLPLTAPLRAALQQGTIRF